MTSGGFERDELFRISSADPVPMFPAAGAPTPEQVARLFRGRQACRDCGKPLVLVVERTGGLVDHPDAVSISIGCAGHGRSSALYDRLTYDRPTRERWGVFNPDSVNWNWGEDGRPLSGRRKDAP